MQQSTLYGTLLAGLYGLSLPVQAADGSTVSLYGLMSVSIESVGVSGGQGGNKATTTRVTDNNSRLGFRGSEDLGNGNSAIWQVESSLRNFEQGGNTDWGTTATLATRNSYVGLANPRFGRLYAGYSDTVYKSLVGSTSEFGLAMDAMSGTIADSWGAGPGYYQLFSRGETRLKNSIHYISPAYAGWQGGLSYGVDETRSNGSNRTRLSLALKYVTGPFRLGAGWDRQFDTAGYEQNNAGSAAPGKHVDFIKLLGTWQILDRTSIGAGFEHASFDAAGNGSSMRQQDWTVEVKQDLSDRLNLQLSYNRLGGLSNPTSGNSDDYRATQWVVGSNYALGKHTSLFAYGTRIHNAALQNTNFAFIPLTTGSNAANTVVLANGNTLHAVGLGLTIAF
ncbi:porin [Aquitalea pelogenes]|uniref:porin n=1 Tax=Aquitalea pelogenes TaxID=1293573 RepID=UPI00078962E9|nr:porin [Aquitalea pelogenes]